MKEAVKDISKTFHTEESTNLWRENYIREDKSVCFREKIKEKKHTYETRVPV